MTNPLSLPAEHLHGAHAHGHNRAPAKTPMGSAAMEDLHARVVGGMETLTSQAFHSSSVSPSASVSVAAEHPGTSPQQHLIRRGSSSGHKVSLDPSTGRVKVKSATWEQQQERRNRSHTLSRARTPARVDRRTEAVRADIVTARKKLWSAAVAHTSRMRAQQPAISEESSSTSEAFLRAARLSVAFEDLEAFSPSFFAYVRKHVVCSGQNRRFAPISPGSVKSAEVSSHVASTATTSNNTENARLSKSKSKSPVNSQVSHEDLYDGDLDAPSSSMEASASCSIGEEGIIDVDQEMGLSLVAMDAPHPSDALAALDRHNKRAA